jgi:hypothetical protein
MKKERITMKSNFENLFTTDPYENFGWITEDYVVKKHKKKKHSKKKHSKKKYSKKKHKYGKKILEAQDRKFRQKIIGHILIKLADNKMDILKMKEMATIKQAMEQNNVCKIEQAKYVPSVTYDVSDKK